MKKMLMAVAAAATLGTTALAMPASAQPYGYGGGYAGGYERGASIDERQAQLQHRIARAEQNGRLNRWEARRLREQLWEIKRVEARYRYDGRLNRWERADVNQRLDNLAFRVRQHVRNDGYGHDRDRYDGYRRY